MTVRFQSGPRGPGRSHKERTREGRPPSEGHLRECVIDEERDREWSIDRRRLLNKDLNGIERGPDEIEDFPTLTVFVKQ